MAGETTITIVGNLTADPEMRYTNTGSAVANFTVASTPRKFDRDSGQWKDGDTLFMRCSVWSDVAENITESLSKGMRVIVQGRLTQRRYTTQDGQERTVVEMQVDEVGPSLRYARAQVTRNQSNYSGSGGGYNRGGFQNSGGGAGGGQNYGGGYQSGGGAGSASGSGDSNGGFNGGGGDDPWATGGTSSFDNEPPF